jgi:N-acetylneuraminic acid mutarotase
MKRRISGILPLSSALTVLMLMFLLVYPAQAASWVTNSPMTTARFDHTATLLPNGKVLVAGGFIGLSYTNSAELYDPATGTWTPTGSMNVPRIGHTATLLMNGKVLVAGGGDFGLYSSAELYDPVSGTWTLTGTMNCARGKHTATLLPDGRVLVSGGTAQGAVPTAEIYDPASQTWVATGEMNVRRSAHTATLLASGFVLVVGGLPTNGSVVATSSVEIYDPASGNWTLTNGLNTARSSHTATLLANGQVFAAGGVDSSGTALSTAELFNPVSGIWTQTNVLFMARSYHTAALLPNGQLLLAGGVSGTNTLTNAEIYDPVVGTSTATAGMTTPHGFGSATLLANGKVLGGGGRQVIESPPPGRGVTVVPTNSSEVYDPTINPATGTNTVTGAMITRSVDHQAILLPKGKVLVVGGEGSSLLSYAELFSPSNGTWTMTGPMTRERDWGLTLTLLPDGTVLAKGGYDYSSFLFQYDSELYNPATGSWTGISPPESDQRVSHSATLLPNGKVLVAGGLGQGISAVSCFGSAALYNPGTKTWTLTGAMRSARWGQVATLLPTGKVLVAGGAVDFDWNRYVPVGITNSAELYDPVSGTWTNTGAMNTARIGHTATLLPNGKVLVSGGEWGPTNVYLSSAELYDPIAGTWTSTGGMNCPRSSHSATLLSNGKVMVAGGNAGTNYLSSVEVYDPATGTWTLTSSLNFARRSHTATLLPSGKVLIAGGYNGNSAYPTNYLSSTELYDAGLGYSNTWQPRITAVTSPLNLGDSLVVTGAQFRGTSEGSSGNTQDSSTDYPLVQLRSIESGQTVFLLSTNWSTNSFASVPVWNFPPGYALATVFVNGIQSTSSIVNISVPIPATTTLTGTAILTNGPLQFCFTNNPGALLGVLATTNLSLPLTNWTKLGGVVEIAPGQFQFSDPQATNAGQRFYNIFAP